jgi:capsular polysaccharide biosynthesis protein
MELQEYIRIIRRRWWIVVLLAVLTAAASFGFSKSGILPTIYEASVKMTARPARPDWGLGQSISSLLRSLAGDITTHSFLARVIDQAQLDMTTDDLLDGKTVFVKDEASDFTITVVVRDPNQEVAKEIANTIAVLFVQDRIAWNDLQDKSDRIDVAIRDEARFASVYSPKTEINTIAGGILGLVLGVTLVVILEWLEARFVRSTEDMERLGISTVGAIPSESSRHG